MSDLASWAVGIVVPARDEAAHVEACIASILAADLPAGVARWIVVVADRCRDDTAARAARALGRHGEVLAIDEANVGAARRQGCERLLAATAGHRLDRTWLLTTDADTAVPRRWITTHLDHAAAGAGAVAGTVVVESFDAHAAYVRPAFEARYVLHGDGTHPHVHGANLGVRADRYRESGGWAPLATAEDHDLWDRVRSLGGDAISTIADPVTTSGRRLGRAPSGFAGLLVDLEAAGGPP